MHPIFQIPKQPVSNPNLAKRIAKAKRVASGPSNGGTTLSNIKKQLAQLQGAVGKLVDVSQLQTDTSESRNPSTSSTAASPQVDSPSDASQLDQDPLQEDFGSMLHAQELLALSVTAESDELGGEKFMQAAIQKLSQPTLPPRGSLAIALLSSECNVTSPRPFVLGRAVDARLKL